MKLSENIRKYRLEKGLTQEALAAKIGVSAQAVSKWETSDTYPDGSLYIPLADALGVPLDMLFGRDTVYGDDLARRIRQSVNDTEEKDRMEYVRALCWQAELGLFGHMVGADEVIPLSKDFTNASYILNDFGFTDMSNGNTPFFTVFPEPEDGWGNAIGDGEVSRRVLETLGKPEVMRAALFLHTKAQGYLFEAGVLSQECDFDDIVCAAVLEELLGLGLVCRANVFIDGEEYRLWRNRPSHRFLALLLYAKEFCYHGGYTVQVHQRMKPLL
ncbi:MAG: helix-turn-helix transcriptional regulator [Clostridia bacterium]|nr:helix-turn-helix transcriptional regulator [Clostridia bacterium]